MKILINEQQYKLLTENVQLADKVYFKTGKISEEEKEFILNLTDGDYSTKVISDMVYAFKENKIHIDDRKFINKLEKIHEELKNYNKNVFPVKDFTFENLSNKSFFFELDTRNEILFLIRQLPSIALRNLRSDIRQERDYRELDDYLNSLQYFITHLSYLENRDENTKSKILNKMFKSNTTIDQLLRFVEDKENLIGGVKQDKEFIFKLIEEHPYDFELIFNKNNVIVVRVESAEGIKDIGCNSLWCFTYGEQNYQQWNHYSYNGMVYVIVNFNTTPDDKEFMHVLIKPLEKQYDEDEDNYPLFDMSNENYYDPYRVLPELLGTKNLRRIFTFRY